jgi:hypothetical protein
MLGGGIAQSAVCLTTDWTTEVRSSAEARSFPVASVSRPGLRPTQPPVQWVIGVLTRGKSAAGARR